MNKSKTAVTTRATYQDVLDAPPNMVAQIVDGVLYTHPRPALPHATAGSVITAIILPAFQFASGGPGGWYIVIEPELHLGEDILVPDIAGWRRERMAEAPKAAYSEVAPDWVCEVLSPSTQKLDLGGKQAVYAREGVSYLWFVDPAVRTLEALELQGSKWVLIDTLFGDASVSLPPFEAISFNLGNLWSLPAIHKDLPKDVPAAKPIEPELKFSAPLK